MNLFKDRDREESVKQKKKKKKLFHVSCYKCDANNPTYLLDLSTFVTVSSCMRDTNKTNDLTQKKIYPKTGNQIWKKRNKNEKRGEEICENRKKKLFWEKSSYRIRSSNLMCNTVFFFSFFAQQFVHSVV